MTKLGALWNNGKGDKKYMSGVIEIDDKKTSIIVFKNDYKREDKQPDYNIFLKEVRKDKPSQEGSHEAGADAEAGDGDNPFF